MGFPLFSSPVLAGRGGPHRTITLRFFFFLLSFSRPGMPRKSSFLFSAPSSLGHRTASMDDDGASRYTMVARVPDPPFPAVRDGGAAYRVNETCTHQQDLTVCAGTKKMDGERGQYVDTGRPSLYSLSLLFLLHKSLLPRIKAVYSDGGSIKLFLPLLVCVSQLQPVPHSEMWIELAVASFCL